MRTTVDLPDDLMRAAKVRAADRGETLKEMFTRLLIRELGATGGRLHRGRVALPLIGADVGARVEVTNADIEAALAAEDARRYGR